ncbi:MAG: hypothetical protein ACO2OW_02820, partial [Minisyncoccia bacterium]
MATVRELYLQDKLQEKMKKIKDVLEKIEAGASYLEVKDTIKKLEPLSIEKKEVITIEFWD